MHHRLNNEQFRTRRLGIGEQIVNGGSRRKKIRLSYLSRGSEQCCGKVARGHQIANARIFYSLFDFDFPMGLRGFDTSREAPKEHERCVNFGGSSRG
jgi:hypothetical protein